MQVTRKSEQEALENLIRRFNRKVLQSGILGDARRNQFFEKSPSKRIQRVAAIKKKQRKDERLKRFMLGK